MAESPTNSVKPLPKSLVTLNIMLKLCCEELEVVDRTRQRNDLRREMAEGIARADRRNVDARTEQLRTLQQAMDEAAVAGYPASDLLWDYCDQGAIKGANHMTVKGTLILSEVAQKCSAEEIVAAYDIICQGNRIQVQALQHLRDKIVAALEGADRRADIQKILAEIEPENEDVRLLYLRLNREAGNDRTKMAIALDFTDQNRNRANNLLRQVRRYEQKLKQALQDDFM